MKKMGILLIIGALVMVSCGKDAGAKEAGKAGTTAGQTAEQGKADLSKETTEYKKYVEGQIDLLLKETEDFAKLLKEGKLDEATVRSSTWKCVTAYFPPLSTGEL